MWVQREVVRYKRTNTFWKLPSGKQSNGILLVYFITAVNKPGGTQPTFVRGDWNDVEYPPQLQSEIWPTRSQRSFESLALASWSAERVTTGEAGAHPSKKRPFSPTDPVRHPPRRATPFYRAAFLVLRLHRASPFNIMSAWPCLALQKPPLLPQAPTRWQLPVTPPPPRPASRLRPGRERTGGERLREPGPPRSSPSAPEEEGGAGRGVCGGVKLLKHKPRGLFASGEGGSIRPGLSGVPPTDRGVRATTTTSSNTDPRTRRSLAGPGRHVSGGGGGTGGFFLPSGTGGSPPGPRAERAPQCAAGRARTRWRARAA